MSLNLSKGIYLAIAASFISGISIFVNKFAVGIIQPPILFTATKNISVGILIICIILIANKWRLIKKLNRRELTYLLLIGVIGGSIPFYLFFTGLSQVPAINAALIQKTLVVWVAIMAIPCLKERISKLQIIAVLILFSSNFIIGGFKGFQFSYGEMLIFAATVFWAIESILAKKILPTVDPDLVVAARMGLGAVILLAATAVTVPAAFNKNLIFSEQQWFWLIVTAAFLLGYVMTWYRALKFAPAITVTSVLTASTLITNILSAIFVTHTWTILMGVQSGLIILGLGFFYFSVKKQITQSLILLPSR